MFKNPFYAYKLLRFTLLWFKTDFINISKNAVTDRLNSCALTQIPANYGSAVKFKPLKNKIYKRSIDTVLAIAMWMEPL